MSAPFSLGDNQMIAFVATRDPARAKVAWFKDPDGNTLSISRH